MAASFRRGFDTVVGIGIVRRPVRILRPRFES
jgi:hypothetical protein